MVAKVSVSFLGSICIDYFVRYFLVKFTGIQTIVMALTNLVVVDVDYVRVLLELMQAVKFVFSIQGLSYPRVNVSLGGNAIFTGLTIKDDKKVEGGALIPKLEHNWQSDTFQRKTC